MIVQKLILKVFLNQRAFFRPEINVHMEHSRDNQRCLELFYFLV